MTRKYDILVVGAGLFGSTIAYEAARVGKRVLVIDRRSHIGGNCHSFELEGIEVHAYGPHVVHTNSINIWEWLNSFVEFAPCMVSPLANYKGEIYNLPFNMNTFHSLWGIATPAEAQEMIDRQRIPCKNPRNLEEHVLDLAGRDVYEKLVKGYAEKQYGRYCSDLPPSLITRMPLLFTYDNDYLHARYQGVPKPGYDVLFKKMLKGSDVLLEEDYCLNREKYRALADNIVFTGPIDEYFDYCYGPLEYRGRRFDHQVLDIDNYQGVSLMNFTDAETPQLRIIEHKHFANSQSDKTIITFEYATPWVPGNEPYYTINDQANQKRYQQYCLLAEEEPNLHFGGRLGEYRYYDMQDTIESAWSALYRWFGLRVRPNGIK